MSMAKFFSNLGFLFKAAIFFSIIFVIVDIIVLRIVMKPQLPSFNLNSVNVTSLNTTTEADLTITFDVVVTVINPNSNTKLSMSYEKFEITMWFGHLTIASGSTTLFWQGVTDTETVIRVQFGTDRKVFPHGVINSITQQRASGSINFGLTLVSRVRFWWCGFFCTRLRPVIIECYPLQIVFSPQNNINSSDNGGLVAPSECYQV